MSGNCRSADFLSHRPASQQYGWFEDFEMGEDNTCMCAGSLDQFDIGIASVEPVRRALSLPPPVTDPPVYILESTLDSQHLWYTTAGTRPRQPPEERKFYEQQWEKNFSESKVVYTDTVVEDKKENLLNLENEFADEEVLERGKGPFSNAVSKSFMNHELSCMTIQVPRFKVVKFRVDGTICAQFLVTVSLGSVTHGVWRRHSDFKSLFQKIYSLNKSNLARPFKNTLCSWECVLSRQRWIRCLDKEYISLKCFLLERCMHDLLFESSSPDLIINFLGLVANTSWMFRVDILRLRLGRNVFTRDMLALVNLSDMDALQIQLLALLPLYFKYLRTLIN